MPELPEVETIKRELQSQILDKEIIDVKILLIRAFKNPLNLSVLGQIEAINRLGKFLIIDIKDKSSLIMHLRMTGKLILGNGENEKHIRVSFLFKDGDRLLFQDIRTFGLIEVIRYKESIYNNKKIGIDALSKEFTLLFFKNMCNSKSIPIKKLLMEQTLIAGIGNIYAMEILFASSVNPTRLSNSLKSFECKSIYEYTIKILNHAIDCNGTTISDYRRVDDKKGEFQNFLKVYGKKVCLVCNTNLTKIKQGGRTTMYCGKCQR